MGSNLAGRMTHIPNRHRQTIESIYANGYARISTASGGWEPCFTTTLEALAYGAADYVHAAREAHAGRPCRDPDDLAAVRIEVRRLMGLNLLLPEGRIHLAEIRADGLDADIARLCGIPDEHEPAAEG